MLARKEAGSASQGVSMARRHFQEGQVYEKAKTGLGAGARTSSKQTERFVAFGAPRSPGSIMADSSTSKCIDDNTLSVLDPHVQDQVESKCQSNHTVAFRFASGNGI
jgi:hypothetical protein